MVSSYNNQRIGCVHSTHYQVNPLDWGEKRSYFFNKRAVDSKFRSKTFSDLSNITVIWNVLMCFYMKNIRYEHPSFVQFYKFIQS